MRILILTQWYQPEPVFKGLPFVKALAEKGHTVEVLTGYPNYPGGRLYSGYHIRPWQREEMAGLRVNRVALYPSHDKSGVRRVLNYLSFAAASFLLGPWLVQGADVIYVYDLVTLGPTAFFLRWLFGARVLLDVLDLWPESVIVSRMVRNQLALRALGGVCRWVYRQADRLTVPTPGLMRALIAQGIPAEKISVIYNWCDEASLHQETRQGALAQELGLTGKFNVMFAGTMGVMQGLDTVLDCAELCRERLPQVQFVLVGGGVERLRLEARVSTSRLDNVKFLPPRPMEAMGNLYALADALLVHLKDEPLSRITIPSKTQAYLYMGKPIIVAISGDAAELVRSSGAGLICEPDDPQAMAEAVQKLVNMPSEARDRMGKAGSRYYEEALSMKAGVDQFEKLMLSLVGHELNENYGKGKR